MKFYIAAKYGRRLDPKVQALRHRMETLGHECTAQWLDNAEESKETRREAAQMDVADVLRADALVFLGEPEGSENRGGGRWFEFGVAYQSGRMLYAVLTDGGHESVFTDLPEVTLFSSFDELLSFLGERTA